MDNELDVRPSEFLRIFRETLGHTYIEIFRESNKTLYNFQQKEQSGTIKLREVIDLAKYYGFESYVICDAVDKDTGETKTTEWHIESNNIADWIKSFLKTFGENQTSMAEALGLHRQKISLNVKRNALKFRTWIKYLDHLGCKWELRDDKYTITSTKNGWKVNRACEDLGRLDIFSTLKGAYLFKRGKWLSTAKAWIVSDDSDGKEDVFTNGVLTELYISREDDSPFIIYRYRDNDKKPDGDFISSEEAKKFIEIHGNTPKLAR